LDASRPLDEVVDDLIAIAGRSMSLFRLPYARSVASVDG